MCILVVDDDVGVARLVQLMLSADGFRVDHATTAEEGEHLALSGDYRGIVLDLGLGCRNGLDVLRTIRAARITTPVLVLTAEADESMIVQALDAGADEYVVKPMRNRELAARVRALVRRNEAAGDAPALTSGTLVLNRLTRKASVGAEQLNLSPREFRLLEHMMVRAGAVVTRTELLSRVWEMEFDPGSNVVDVYVRYLRTKVGAHHIATVRGAGYRWE